MGDRAKVQGYCRSDSTPDVTSRFVRDEYMAEHAEFEPYHTILCRICVENCI